jgi:hypothetical protein
MEPRPADPLPQVLEAVRPALSSGAGQGLFGRALQRLGMECGQIHGVHNPLFPGPDRQFARKTQVISAIRTTLALTGEALTALNADGIQGAPDDVVTNAGEVLHAATPHEHDRVLLEVVADAGNIGGHFKAAREADAGHLAQRRIGLLGCGRVNANTDAAPLRTGYQRRGCRLLSDLLPAFSH